MFGGDGCYRTEGRPGVIGLHWTNHFDLGEDWIARFVLLTATEIGNGASGDLVMQTRAMIAYSINPTLSAGLDDAPILTFAPKRGILEAKRTVVVRLFAANRTKEY